MVLAYCKLPTWTWEQGYKIAVCVLLHLL